MNLSKIFGRGLMVAVLTLTFASGLVYQGSAIAGKGKGVDNGHASATGKANASVNAGGRGLSGIGNVTGSSSDHRHSHRAGLGPSG